MTPLQTFLDTAKKLAAKPIDFWPATEQAQILKYSVVAIQKLKTAVEAKKLTDTHAYKQLVLLGKYISPTKISEVGFIQQLVNLVDIYRHAPAPDETQELIAELDKNATRAKQRILEHHLSLEHLVKKAKKMTAADKEKHDRETIKKVGIFYVLEYTLQVLFEFTQLSDAQKMALLKEGLKTKAGNLPAYYPLEDTMRKELCYKLFDEKLRNQLLSAFYQLEEVLYCDDMNKVGKGLKIFNAEILKAFQAKGLKMFKGLVYAPFGNNVPVKEIIKQIESIKKIF